MTYPNTPASGTSRPGCDIVKIREWTEDPEWDGEWPDPPVYIESLVLGRLRADILARLGRPVDASCEVTIIECTEVGGHSEYTAEHYFDVEVWVHEDRQAQLVWKSATTFDEASALSSFLIWATSK